MIKYLTNKNNYDFIHQFSWIKSANNKIKLKILIIDCNNNNIIKNNNLIYPTYYSFLLLFNQKPLIKTSNKSIANFNVRINMNLGIFLSINKNNLIWNNIFYYINTTLPQSINISPIKDINVNYHIQSYYDKQHQGSNCIIYNSQHFKQCININKLYDIQINYGIKNINNINNSIFHFKLIDNGANMIFKFNSPVKFLPFYYLPQ